MGTVPRGPLHIAAGILQGPSWTCRTTSISSKARKQRATAAGWPQDTQPRRWPWVSGSSPDSCWPGLLVLVCDIPWVPRGEGQEDPSRGPRGHASMWLSLLWARALDLAWGAKQECPHLRRDAGRGQACTDPAMSRAHLARQPAARLWGISRAPRGAATRGVKSALEASTCGAPLALEGFGFWNILEIRVSD